MQFEQSSKKLKKKSHSTSSAWKDACLFAYLLGISLDMRIDYKK